MKAAGINKQPPSDPWLVKGPLYEKYLKWKKENFSAAAYHAAKNITLEEMEAMAEEAREAHPKRAAIAKFAENLERRHKLGPLDAITHSLFHHGFRTLARYGGKYEHANYLQEKLEGILLDAPPIRDRGASKRERSLLRPKWVSVSEAARVLGVERNTIMKWCPRKGKNTIMLPANGAFRSYTLERGPLGQVNLTLLQHIAEQKRALPGPGRRLGGQGSRELVEAATRAHTDPGKAADYARTCKALSLLGRVQSGPLLQAARRQLNRLILRRRRA